MKSAKFVVLMTLGYFLASPAWAVFPEVLRGAWMVDTEATAANLKNSPKWDEQSAQFLPMVLERMSVVICTFDNGAMTVSDGTKKDALAVELKTSEARRYVFAGKSGDDEVTIRAAFTEEGLLNIRTSTTDDMDYYLWKRAPRGAAPKMTLPPAAQKLLQKNANPSAQQPAS